MATEIERKFLVKGEFRSHVKKSVRIVQGYLSSDPDRIVRIRIRDESGFITVKGGCSASGTSRYEWEKEIPFKEAEELMKLCHPEIIYKTRHIIHCGKHIYEVDEFHGDNDGLIISEIELNKEDESFIKPEWLGKEVTGDHRYYNSSLSIKPFKTW
ncbi:MAG: CYTH domain-containing protein [Bacteroidales bacterium]|nr:CYTH domain-containing protein [Bacteroidales bacterium]